MGVRRGGRRGEGEAKGQEKQEAKRRRSFEEEVEYQEAIKFLLKSVDPCKWRELTMGRETVKDFTDAVKNFLQPLLHAGARFSRKVYHKALVDVLDTSEKQRIEKERKDREATAIAAKEDAIEEKKLQVFKCMVDVVLSGKCSPSVYEIGRHASARQRELSACATEAQSLIAANLESMQLVPVEDCQSEIQQCSMLAKLQRMALDSIDRDGSEAHGGDRFVMPPNCFNTRVYRKAVSTGLSVSRSAVRIMQVFVEHIAIAFVRALKRLATHRSPKAKRIMEKDLCALRDVTVRRFESFAEQIDAAIDKGQAAQEIDAAAGEAPAAQGVAAAQGIDAAADEAPAAQGDAAADEALVAQGGMEAAAVMDEVRFSQVKALLRKVGAKADAKMLPRLGREWLNLMGRTVEYAAAAAKSACSTEIEAVHVLAAIREEALDYAGYRSVSGTGRKQAKA